jgi:SAM-dependent methyltransferase
MALPRIEPAPVRHEFEDRTSALVYDLTQPYILDTSCFAAVISREAAAYGQRPRIVGIGCGTGLLSLKILRALLGFEYHGLDRSKAMVDLFASKAAELPANKGTVRFTAPVDLRLRASLENLGEPSIDLAVLSQFLQYVPEQPPSAEFVSKEEFLRRILQMLQPAGKMFVVEDVFGENQEEHMALSAAWDRAVLANYAASWAGLEAALQPVQPEFVAAIRKMLQQPSLMHIVRERRRQTRGEEILPLSKWKGMLERLGVRYRILPHATLPNFYLFALEKSQR